MISIPSPQPQSLAITSFSIPHVPENFRQFPYFSLSFLLTHNNEAADIDGISTLRRFFCITLPMMVPTLFFVSVMSFIEILQIFDVVFLMFDRALVESDVMTVTNLFYKYAFYLQEKGYASAITVVLFAVTLLITLIQMMIGKRLKVS